MVKERVSHVSHKEPKISKAQNTLKNELQMAGYPHHESRCAGNVTTNGSEVEGANGCHESLQVDEKPNEELCKRTT